MTRPAYRADGRTVEREAFYALACDPGRSVVVEACAGAGKTWMLVSRILRALLAGAQPQEILAITFTRKAAGEMRERLNQWLREFAAPGTPAAARVQALVERGVPAQQAQAWAGDLATLHQRLLQGGRAVQIRTFHAWFSQLLRVAPLRELEALGLQPQMTLIEDLQEHRAPVLRRFHAALLAQPQRQRDYAELSARRGRGQLQKWLDAAWDKRVEFELADEAGVLESSVPPPPPQAGDSAAHEHPSAVLRGARWQAWLAEVARTLERAPGVAARDAAQALRSACGAADPRGIFDQAWAALYTQADAPRRHLGSVAGVAALQDALAALAARIAQFEARVEHLQMCGLTRLLLHEYAAYKRERGLADMADLERCGLALLRDATLSGWVQQRLDARIRHVLIDEFQDTSPLQWHALHAWLAAYAGAGGGASGQRPPGVFIVGDPKQSIYRFRRAEPRVFEAAREFVVQALGGTVLECDHTRRNAAPVLVAVNGVFERAQASGETAGFRAHTTEVDAGPGCGVFVLPAVARAPRAARAVAGAPAAWRDSLVTPRLTPEEVLREQEASHVARAVHTLAAAPGWSAADILVLSRKRQSLRLVAQALQRLHVACAAVDDTELMGAAEARDLVALLDALVSPRHALSLAQALRSPLFGVDDDDLVALAERARTLSWWRAVVQDPWPERAALQRARELLVRWQRAAVELPPHDLLDRIVHEGQLRERVAAVVPAERRAAALDAIDAVLAQALTLDAARYASPYNFVRALKHRVVRVAAPAHAQAVQLLTVHGAKGLEARAVFVMDAWPETKSGETTTLMVDWPVQAERPLRCAFVYSEAACPPSLAPLLAAEVAAREREELNALYVAMTRARERLVFSATEPQRPGPAPAWWDRVAPFGQAWPEPPGATAAAQPAALAPAVLWDSAPLPEPDAAEPAATGDDGDVPRTGDAAATGLGQAVHRVLEWAAPAWDRGTVPHGTPPPPALDLDAWAQAAAQVFDADAVQVARLARTILDSAQCAPYFRGPGLLWAGNEVPVGIDGVARRIDRLVCLDDGQGPVWWVLDYKLQHAPQALQAYREQLLSYWAAVRRAQPLDRVRCAFVTGAGAVVALDTDAPGRGPVGELPADPAI